MDRQNRQAAPEPAAERLLFTGYRCWMAGYSTRDIACWEIAWNALAAQVGVGPARLLYGEFHCFVRTILEQARREIGWRPAACRCLCPDEALVLALVEAAQQRRTGEEQTRAGDLLGHTDCDVLIETTRLLVQALGRHGPWLRPVGPGTVAAAHAATRKSCTDSPVLVANGAMLRSHLPSSATIR